MPAPEVLAMCQAFNPADPMAQNTAFITAYRARLDSRAIDDGETFTRGGHTFKIAIVRDDDMGAPWKEHDGHGPVSDWRRSDKIGADKSPGERVLCRDRHSYRLYDFQEAVRIARRDGWGCKHSYVYDLGRRVFVSGHRTPGESAQCAAETDFDRLRRWCADDWYWIGVVVTLADPADSADPCQCAEPEEASLFGIESDAGAYLTAVAHDLADEIIGRIEVDNPDIQRSEN